MPRAASSSFSRTTSCSTRVPRIARPSVEIWLSSKSARSVSQGPVVFTSPEGGNLRTDPWRTKKRRGIRGASSSTADERQAAIASCSSSSSGPWDHMYAENRGVVAGSQPREITMPTGSSSNTSASCFIWYLHRKRMPPERSGASRYKAARMPPSSGITSRFAPMTYVI